MKAAVPAPLHALVPARRFTQAKSRLASVLTAAERAELARGLFDHVVGLALAHPAIDRVVVCTDAFEVARYARGLGCGVLRDEGSRGLGPVIARGLEHVAEEGAAGALVLMADLPRLGAEELDALVGLMARFPVIAAPDAQDRGTNALALSPPGRIPTRFGRMDSFQHHRAVAMGHGLPFHAYRAPGLAFDVDTPEALAELRGPQPG